MEVVSSIVSGAVVETGRRLCGSIYSTIKKIVKGPQRLDLLESNMKSLTARRDDAAKEMELAEREGKVIKAEATVWLRKVEELKHKCDDQIQEAKSSRCFFSCLTKRYRINTKVAKHLGEIERLLEVGSSLAGSVVLNYSEVKAVEHIPGPSIQDQTASVSEELDKTMTLLFDNRFRRIGIWGMGGVGKTNLVRNLNNKLLEINSNMPFSCVLWVTVSKTSDIKKLQMGIASRLGLNLEESSGADRIAIQLHQRLLKEKSFLLILDDVWKKVDLDILGVPRPEVHSGSKIILTSRSLDVCRDMLTDFNVEMSVLGDKDAWKLFSRYATDVVSLEHITPLAEAICKECKGLPLAIITMGAAMRGKTNREVWKHTLNQLRKSVPVAEGVEEALYRPLKLSYDSLERKDLKTCFLYCSLFPEDFSIEIDELVSYWLAEGLIDDRENYEDFYSRGISLIENLKDACLLEDGSYEDTVKMHDIVRDVSIWIASSTCGEDGSKSLVRSGNGLKEISATELSNSLKRVSFMDNDLERLPDDSVIQCSEASTLLLQNNRRLDLIPERFLEGFEALRVLNISGTRIKSLPVSLLQLDDLRALLLSNCRGLEELPPLERLSRLQVLDLSWTGIRELPRGLEQLSNLRHLNLSGTDELQAVQAGVISKLSSLEVLDLSCYLWNLEELLCLERLQVFSIILEWNPSHSSEDTIISLTNRLKAFRIVIADDSARQRMSYKIEYLRYRSQLLGAQRCVIMDGIDLSGVQIWRWLSNASYLCLSGCRGLNEMLQDLVINSVGSFTYLKRLDILGLAPSLQDSYLDSFTIQSSSFRTGGLAAKYDLLPNLEELRLLMMRGIESISELVNHLGLRFQRLKKISVFGCQEMKYLLSLGNSVRTMPNLEEIENLYRDENTWPGIDLQVDVIDCDLLRTEQ